ncbi:MAG: stage II sporulation protein D [Turicibacter sp.]|nr:stage II sporulation protein D [Turicibacter sp.]
MKSIVALSFSFILILTLIPLAVFLTSAVNMPTPTLISNGTWEYSAYTTGKKEEIEALAPTVIPVMRYADDRLEEIDLEDYVKGVVASEMYPSFEMEALKAQAIVARTFVLYSLQSSEHVLDTVMDQVFRDEGQLRERWSADFDGYWARITEAVDTTEGLVVKYDGQLVETLFFAMTNGFTENSEDVFGGTRAHLRSIESPWDTGVPNFEVETEFTLQNFRNALGDSSLTVSDIAILSRTPGGRVAEVQVGNTTMRGTQFRSALGLRSADFRVTSRNNLVVITTRGSGHGVGMSQHGANQMALAGKTYADILRFYYQGIEIVPNH